VLYGFPASLEKSPNEAIRTRCLNRGQGENGAFNLFIIEISFQSGEVMRLVTKTCPINAFSSWRDGSQVAVEMRVQFLLFVILGNSDSIICVQRLNEELTSSPVRSDVEKLGISVSRLYTS
jgi:hypothetical protein